MRNFQELLVWQKSHQITLTVYHLTRTFPADERYGLTSQLRRSASSIAANIAEGCGRDSNRDFCRFLRIASGSASETLYHVILARDLKLIEMADYDKVQGSIDEIRRMLTALIRRFGDPPNSTN